MEIGLLVEVPPIESSARAIADLADALVDGIDAIWLRGRPGAANGTLLCAAALADATERVRIGIAEAPSPTLHPLRLAEDLAMIDITSGGRLDWVPLHDPAADRVHDAELLEIVLEAWRGEPFEYAGQYWRFPELVCVPSPDRRPHPPIWLADGTATPACADPSATGRWLEGLEPSESTDAHAPLARLCRADVAARVAAESPDWLIVSCAEGSTTDVPGADALRRLIDGIIGD